MLRRTAGSARSGGADALALTLSVLVCVSAACSDPDHCFVADAPFLTTQPNFVGAVAQVTYEDGRAPSGVDIAQYAIWVTVQPHTSPNAGILLSRSTPVFQPGLFGDPRSSAACFIKVGDQVEVWHDNQWAPGAAEAPPGDTLYFPIQVLVRR